MALTKLRQDYVARTEAASKALREWYADQLSRLETSLTARGDVPGSLAIKRERALVLAAAPKAIDPIVGKWAWLGNVTVQFDENGTCTSDGHAGTWRFLDNPEAERKYKLDWNHGQFVNDMIFSHDGRSAQVEDPRSNASWGTRKLSQ